LLALDGSCLSWVHIVKLVVHAVDVFMCTEDNAQYVYVTVTTHSPPPKPGKN